MTAMGTFSYVLVPTDGSEYSVAAGRLAIDIAHTYGARLGCLYVIDRVVVNELSRFGDKSTDQVRRELEDKGQSALNYLERLAADWGLKAELFLREGVPHTEILALSRQLGADLIVVGQVGVRGPRRMLIGSVAERVIEAAECPVLIAKK
jgi:nucleotide-binding universal stress UspA family protein